MTGDVAIAGGLVVTPEGVRAGTVVIRAGVIAGVAAPGEAVAGPQVDAGGQHRGHVGPGRSGEIGELLHQALVRRTAGMGLYQERVFAFAGSFKQTGSCL